MVPVLIMRRIYRKIGTRAKPKLAVRAKNACHKTFWFQIYENHKVLLRGKCHENGA